MISIPYGAIKSNKLFYKDRDKKGISIPYGAIKSVCYAVFARDSSEFQFLMVRLKAYFAFSCTSKL